MNRVRAWLTWSPFERGTWQQLALNLLILLVVMTIVQACLGDLSIVSWFGGLTGIAVVAAVLGVPIYRSRGAPAPTNRNAPPWLVGSVALSPGQANGALLPR